MNVKMEVDPRSMPDGAVLVLSVRFTADEGQRPNPTIYAHAAIKARGRWFLTGRNAPQDASWGAVEAWLERNNRKLVQVEIATGARTIWPVVTEAQVVDPVEIEEDPPGPSYYDPDEPVAIDRD